MGRHKTWKEQVNIVDTADDLIMQQGGTSDMDRAKRVINKQQQEIELLREAIEESVENESKLVTAQAGNRMMDAAIKRSGFVLTECDQCGLLVVHLEDGMPPLCVDCAKKCGA